MKIVGNKILTVEQQQQRDRLRKQNFRKFLRANSPANFLSNYDFSCDMINVLDEYDSLDEVLPDDLELINPDYFSIHARIN